MDQYGPILSKLVRYGPIWSSAYRGGPHRTAAHYGVPRRAALMVAAMPIPPFFPSRTNYLFAEVADHLELRIQEGRQPAYPVSALPPGAQLSAEPELAAEYGVSLATIRRALQELRERGLVVTLPSKGTFVRE